MNHPELPHHEHHGGGHGEHAADFRNRFLITSLLAIPVVVFSMMALLGQMRTGRPSSDRRLN